MLLTALVLPARAPAEPGPPAPPPLAGLAALKVHLPAPVRTRLGNGLEVLLQEYHRQPQVAVIVEYEVGSRDAPREHAELAHLVERLTYTGSEHLPGHEGERLLESAGAHDLQSVTHPDYTWFQTVVPARALATALWVERERMGYTLDHFDERSLEHEKRAVASEVRREQGPEASFDKQLREAMFGLDHPYARLATNDLQFESLDLGEVRAFYSRAYRPDNARLILVGDFQTRAAQKLVEKYFGSLQNPRVSFVRPLPEGRPQFVSREVRLEHPNAPHEKLVVAWPLSPPSARARLVWDVFRTLSFRRLRERLKQRSGAVSRVWVETSSFETGFVFMVSVDLMQGVTHDAVEAKVVEELEKPWRSDDDHWLREATQSVVVSELEDLETPLRLGLAELSSLRLFGQPLDLAQRLTAYRAVNMHEINVLQAALRDSARFVGRLMRPTPNGSDSASNVSNAPRNE